MTENDVRRFAAAFKACCLNYGKDVSEEYINVIWNCLLDLAIEDVCLAFKNHIYESRFMPTVADIRNRVKSQRRARRRAYVSLEPPPAKSEARSEDHISQSFFMDKGLSDDEMTTIMPLGLRRVHQFAMLQLLFESKAEIIDIIRAAIIAEVDGSMSKEDFMEAIRKQLPPLELVQDDLGF